MKSYLRVLIVCLLAIAFSPESALADTRPNRGHLSFGQTDTADLRYGHGSAPARLYKRRSTSSMWKASFQPAELEQVVCEQAKNALTRHGRWVGNLNRDGSCGEKAEPSEWITEGHLNFLIKK